MSDREALESTRSRHDLLSALLVFGGIFIVGCTGLFCADAFRYRAVPPQARVLR